MNFFDSQDRAKRKTFQLIILFCLMVLAVIAVTDVAIYYLIRQGINDDVALHEPVMTSFGEFDAVYLLLASVSFGLFFIIFIGSLIRWFQLRGGADSIVRMLNARQVTTPDNILEKRLVNVVEEMAIASGIGVPRIYILDEEEGINAFVAGNKPSKAILVVTAGLLKILNRDELQAVIGHEYSHLFNGDISINLRLMYLVAGVMAVSQMGKFILHFSGSTRSRYRSRSSKNTQGILMFGLALFIIGYVGYLIGLLLKAKISRQREFLADAISAQFTRNPTALAQALMKIKYHQSGSLLTSSRSEDISHFCFGSPVKSFTGLLSTHPPIDERIEALDPNKQALVELTSSDTPSVDQQTEVISIGGGDTSFNLASSVAVIGTVGQPSESHFALAKTLHSQIPKSLLMLARDEKKAICVIYGLLLVASRDTEKTKAVLENCLDTDQVQAIYTDKIHLSKLHDCLKLPLVQITLVALRALSNEERVTLVKNTEEIIHSDGKRCYFEWLMVILIDSHLYKQKRHGTYCNYVKLQEPLSRLMAELCYHSGETEEAQLKNYAAAMESLALDVKMPARSTLTLSRLRLDMRQLRHLKLHLKKTLLEACCDCVSHDGNVTLAEGEAVRVISNAIECPLPPLWVSDVNV